MGAMILSSFAFPLLGVATLQDLAMLVRTSVGGVHDEMVYAAFGTMSALISFFLVGVLLGRPHPVHPPAHSLVAVCLLMIAIAPELLIFCVPLTLGIYVSLLSGSAAGAFAGGALGRWMVVKLAHGL